MGDTIEICGENRKLVKEKNYWVTNNRISNPIHTSKQTILLDA